MSSMIDRGARAIWMLNTSQSDDPEIRFDEFGDETHWSQYRVEARAVLEAIRIPNDDMCDAGIEHTPTPVHVWCTMIETALNE